MTISVIHSVTCGEFDNPLKKMAQLYDDNNYQAVVPEHISTHIEAIVNTKELVNVPVQLQQFMLLTRRITMSKLSLYVRIRTVEIKLSTHFVSFTNEQTRQST